jgi:hypothetical protein
VLTQAFLLRGVAAPLLAGFAATLLAGRVSKGRRGVGATGLVIGQLLGVVLAGWGQSDWFPDRNLEWVSWATVGAAAIGPSLAAGGITAFERWILSAAAALAAAALIVPDWPELWPPRSWSILGVTAAMTSVVRGADGVTRRAPPGLVAVSMTLTAMASAALIAASLSLKLGESAFILGSSLCGAAAALVLRPDESAVRGLALPYAIAVGGWCYVSAIELPPPAPPLIGLLFVPCAPLVLWLVSLGPLARRNGRVRWSVGLLLVLAYLAAVGAWTWMSTESTENLASLGIDSFGGF